MIMMMYDHDTISFHSIRSNDTMISLHSIVSLSSIN